MNMSVMQSPLPWPAQMIPPYYFVSTQLYLHQQPPPNITTDHCMPYFINLGGIKISRSPYRRHLAILRHWLQRLSQSRICVQETSPRTKVRTLGPTTRRQLRRDCDRNAGSHWKLRGRASYPGSGHRAGVNTLLLPMLGCSVMESLWLEVHERWGEWLDHLTWRWPCNFCRALVLYPKSMNRKVWP